MRMCNINVHLQQKHRYAAKMHPHQTRFFRFSCRGEAQVCTSLCFSCDMLIWQGTQEAWCNTHTSPCARMPHHQSSCEAHSLFCETC